MPRRRLRRSFKRRFSRASRSGKSGLARMVDSRARRQLRLSQIRGVEHKLFDFTMSTNVTAAGLAAYFPAMAAGTDVNNRIGRQITIESIQFRYDTAMNAAATSEGIRIMLIYTINPQAFATFVVGDYLAGTPSVNSPLNISAHQGELIVMYDKLHRFSITGEQRQFGNFFKKLNHKVRWYGPNATDFKMGQFLILAISDNTPNPPGLELYGRVRFRDD